MKLGPSISQHIRTEKILRYKNGAHTSDFKGLRNYLFIIFITLAAILLLGKLFFLQIIQGNYYRNLSDSNRIRTQLIHAPRGIIFDRNGNPLVLNTPGFREVVNGKTIILDPQEGLARIASGDRNLEIDSLRKYTLGEAASHLVGYIGQISPDELSLTQFSGFSQGELIGKMGIEKQYEDLLKGVDGKTLFEVDATGKPVRNLGQTDPIPGQNITTTIDAHLQQAVFSAMKDVKKGAAIVSTPNGEILALVSKPSFDPNMFTLGKAYVPDNSSSYQTVQQVLLDSQNQPFLNRAISGAYPPGSTFKLVTAAAGLETGTIDQNFTIEDTGILKVGDFSFANWYYTDYGKTEGTVDVVKAIQRSNDIFFYKVGSLLGVDKLANFAGKFGLGKTLGIPLSGEVSGLMPTSAWKEKVVGDKWYLGDDYHLGIGQGYLLTTPLQVNSWTQTIANGGTVYQPELLKNQPEKVLNKGFLSQKTIGLLRQGMIEACSTGGVAWPLFNFGIPFQELEGKVSAQDTYTLEASASAQPNQVGIRVACKTGTAQHGDDTTLPHSWITLFAPAYNPQIVVTIIAEDSGEGSNVAGPIAKQILTSWFEK